MSDELSIINPRENLGIESTRAETAADNAALAVKTALGYVPAIGPILSEVVGVIIPDRKRERLIEFAQVLGDRVKYLESDLLEQKMRTDEFADLLEDALHQAARSLTPERREYIAALLKNSLTSDELAHVEEKKLLSLLGELDDAEIVILVNYSLRQPARAEFSQKHSELLAPINRSLGSPQTNIDRGALRDSYRTKLLELGLIEPAYKKPDRGQSPEFDEKTGRLKATSLKVTSLGRLLLRYIDLEQTAGRRDPKSVTEDV